MNELHFKPAISAGLAGEKPVAIGTLDAPVLATIGARGYALARRRRRINPMRFTFEDAGFRLFRVY